MLAGLALLPVYLMHKRALDPEQYARGTEETVQYSASVEAFLASSSWNRLYADVTDPFRVIGPNNLFPGLVVPGLVLAGAVVTLRRRAASEPRGGRARGAARRCRARRARAAHPRLRPRPGTRSVAALRDTIPLFRMIRVTSRAGVFVALPLVMLAAMALAKLKPRPFVLAGLAVLGLAETLIAPIPMPKWSQLIDTRRDPPPVYPWLASLPGRDPIVELPMFDVYALERRPAFHDSVYMVYSTLHWKPLANGYAGIEPRSYVQLRELSRGFPAEDFLDALRRIGVRYVVLHRKGYGPLPVAAAAGGHAVRSRVGLAARGHDARERPRVRGGAGRGAAGLRRSAGGRGDAAEPTLAGRARCSGCARLPGLTRSTTTSSCSCGGSTFPGPRSPSSGSGRLVKARGYGMASLELGAAASAATVYELGSNTKPFTAAAVLMLADEGRLSLDDPLSKYFPQAPPAWAGITLRHLLTHTSGIQNHVAVPGYMDVFKTDLSFRTTPGVEELVRMFFRLPLEFQPGESWAYDNTGYYLLGLVVEKASGRSYWQFLEERIFRPLEHDGNAQQ